MKLKDRLVKAVIKKGIKRVDREIKRLLPDELIDETVRWFTKSHRSFFACPKKKEFTPMVVVMGVNANTGKTTSHVIGTEFPEGKTRQEVMSTVGKRNIDIKPMAVMWAAEAWVSKNPKLAPSKDPKRTSTVFSAFLSADGRTMSAMQAVKGKHKLGRTVYVKGKDGQDNVTCYFYKGWLDGMRGLMERK
jgi:hypothetical protein